MQSDYITERLTSAEWGDNYNNRSDRYLACVAYLNGETPSMVMCRGYYTAAYLWVVDFDGAQLSTRWFHASDVSGTGAYGEGAHGISVGDIFGDWREEQIYYDGSTKSRLMIFSTPYPTEYSMPTLMHDHHYRMATVWQTSAYNQPPHLSFYLPDYLDAQDAGIVDATLVGHGDVVSARYYDLSGRALTGAPSGGFYIIERIYADGAVVVDKILR